MMLRTQRFPLRLLGLISILFAVTGIACAPARHSSENSKPGQNANANTSHPGGKAPGDKPSVVGSRTGFTSRQRLQEHFEKHGAEFGKITIDDYLALAQTLRDQPSGADVLEITRADGITTRFDRRSGAFVAFNSDRTIRTFFKPNDGEAYFRRQARR
jgi:pyocin large subunit-like protein